MASRILKIREALHMCFRPEGEEPKQCKLANQMQRVLALTTAPAAQRAEAAAQPWGYGRLEALGPADAAVRG